MSVRTIVYPVTDLEKAKPSTLLDAGAQPRDDVRDVGGGKLVASVTDADGNVVALLQEASHAARERGPAWRGYAVPRRMAGRSVLAPALLRDARRSPISRNRYATAM